MGVDYFKYFIILVTAVIPNRRREILFLKRSPENKTFKGFWQLPEGKIEFGEEATHALSRELKEEIGVDLVKAKILMTSSTLISIADQNFHLLRLVFKVKTKGKINLSKEHSAYRWLTVKKALQLYPLFPGIEKILKELGEKAQG